MNIISYTDGSSKGNPGVAGWGWVSYIFNEEKDFTIIEVEDWGGEDYATNSKMEIKAILRFLGWFKNCTNTNIEIYSDSEYCVKTLVGTPELTNIIFDKKNKPQGWMNRWFGGETLSSTYYEGYWLGDRKNGELWYKIYQLLVKHKENGNNIKIGWVKGHATNIGNIKADKLSNKYSENKLI